MLFCLAGMLVLKMTFSPSRCLSMGYWTNSITFTVPIFLDTSMSRRMGILKVKSHRHLAFRDRAMDSISIRRYSISDKINEGISNIAAGHLYVVATPIGNLGDISARAVDTLRHCDIIAAEDTRVTSNLLRHLGVSGKALFSLHGNSGPQSTEALLAKVKEGRSVALVSDAGTPCISDPGQSLVAACGEAGIPVHSVPGPSALTAALSVAGFPGKDVLYKGFLPLKGKQRKDELHQIRDFPGIVVLYEAPHRVLTTLEDLVAVDMGPRRCVCCREITKRHESVFRGSVNDCLHAAKTGKSDHDSEEAIINIRGEFVFVLGPAECHLYSDEPAFQIGGQQRQDSKTRDTAVSEELSKLREDGIQRSEAVRIVCDLHDLSKSAVYAVALSMEW